MMECTFTSDVHMQSCEAELAATRAMKEGSIIQQLQHAGEQEKLENRTAIRSLLKSLHQAPFYSLMAD